MISAVEGVWNGYASDIGVAPAVSSDTRVRNPG